MEPTQTPQPAESQPAAPQPMPQPTVSQQVFSQPTAQPVTSQSIISQPIAQPQIASPNMEKLLKKERTFRIVSLCGFLVGLLGFFIIWLAELGFSIGISFLIASISQRRVNKKIIAGEALNTKRGPVCSIISLILTFISPVILLYCLIISGGSGNENGAGAIWWLFVIYYWTAGVPIFVMWLTLGILGLNSTHKKLAITSLIIHPISLVLFAIVVLLIPH